MNEEQKTIVLERALTQDDFNAFAALSGDDNPIHVDPDFSARTSFGRTVSHGMLLYTVLRGLADGFAPGARQLSQTLKFPAPAFADEPIRFEARIINDAAAQRTVAMRATRRHDGACVCEGECVFALEQGTSS